MTDEELNGIGQGIVMHLKKACQTPGDAMSVMVYVLLVLYQFKPETTTMTFDDFINGFREHCLSTYKLNSPEKPVEYKLQ